MEPLHTLFRMQECFNYRINAEPRFGVRYSCNLVVTSTIEISVILRKMHANEVPEQDKGHIRVNEDWLPRVTYRHSSTEHLVWNPHGSRCKGFLLEAEDHYLPKKNRLMTLSINWFWKPFEGTDDFFFFIALNAELHPQAWINYLYSLTEWEGQPRSYGPSVMIESKTFFNRLLLQNANCQIGRRRLTQT